MLSLCLCLVPQVSPFIFFFFFWSMPCGMWDLISLTRDQTCSSALEAESHNHWTARKSPSLHFFCVFSSTTASEKLVYLHCSSWLDVPSMSQKRARWRSFHLPVKPSFRAVTKVQGERPTSTTPHCGHYEARILPLFCPGSLALCSADSLMVTKWLLKIQHFKQTQQHPSEEETVLILYLSFVPNIFIEL